MNNANFRWFVHSYLDLFIPTANGLVRGNDPRIELLKLMKTSLKFIYIINLFNDQVSLQLVQIQ